MLKGEPLFSTYRKTFKIFTRLNRDETYSSRSSEPVLLQTYSRCRVDIRNEDVRNNLRVCGAQKSGKCTDHTDVWSCWCMGWPHTCELGQTNIWDIGPKNQISTIYQNLFKKFRSHRHLFNGFDLINTIIDISYIFYVCAYTRTSQSRTSLRLRHLKGEI